jgi:DNA-binding XRE family transcriptional regulator
MGTFIHRPTPPGGNKRERTWLLHGSWGKRTLNPMSPTELYQQLHCELVNAGILLSDSVPPSRKHHQDVTMAVMQASWIDERWVPDESLGDRLRRLRNETELSQEKFAEKFSLPLGTIKALESGARGENATWTTLAAIAKALDKPITIFSGVEGIDIEQAQAALAEACR